MSITAIIDLVWLCMTCQNSNSCINWYPANFSTQSILLTTW